MELVRLVEREVDGRDGVLTTFWLGAVMELRLLRRLWDEC